MAVSKMFWGRFKGVKESVKWVSRKFYKKFQGWFKNLSIKFCCCNFVVAWNSSQLPEQKEGLFILARFVSYYSKEFNKSNFISADRDENKHLFTSILLHFSCGQNVKISVCLSVLSPQFGLWLVIRGDNLAGSLTLRANKPAWMSPSLTFRSLEDILTGSLTLTASEPARISFFPVKLPFIRLSHTALIYVT